MSETAKAPKTNQLQMTRRTEEGAVKILYIANPTSPCLGTAKLFNSPSGVEKGERSKRTTKSWNVKK